MSKKLYVGNLPYSLDNAKLEEMAKPFGEIMSATIIADKFSGRSKGFGFVEFVNDADADKAIAELNGKEIDGRAIVVNEARPKGTDGGYNKRGGGGGDRGGRGGGGFRDRDHGDRGGRDRGSRGGFGSRW